jgi:hypothetical protein
MVKKLQQHEPVKMSLPEKPSCMMSDTPDLENRPSSENLPRNNPSLRSGTAPLDLETIDPEQEGANLLKLQSCQSLTVTPLSGYSEKAQTILGSF